MLLKLLFCTAMRTRSMAFFKKKERKELKGKFSVHCNAVSTELRNMGIAVLMLVLGS